MGDLAWKGKGKGARTAFFSSDGRHKTAEGSSHWSGGYVSHGGFSGIGTLRFLVGFGMDGRGADRRTVRRRAATW